VISEPVRFARQDKTRLRLRAVVFGGATIAGAAAVGTLLGWSASSLVLHSAFSAVLALIAVALAVVQLLRPRLRLSFSRWQVPREWMRHFWLGATTFGLVMGAGIFTRTPSAVYYVYIAGCAMSGSAAMGLVFGVAYGMTYAVALPVAARLWRDSPPGGQADRAQVLLRRAHLAGTAAAPIVLALAILA